MKIRIPKIVLDFSTRLYLWTTVLILVTFGGIALMFHTYGMEREEEIGQRYTGLLLNDLAHKINERIITVENTLKHHEPFLVAQLDHPDSLMSVVRKWALSDSLIAGGALAFEPYYYPDKGEYFMPYVTRTLGNKPVAKYLGGKEYDYFNMDWYMHAKEQREPVWSEPYYDDGGGDVMMVTYAIPLFDENGNVFAVMTADMSLESFSKDVSTLSPYPGSYSFVLSRDGTFIYHPKRNLILNETIFSFADSIQSESTRQFGHDMLAGKTGYDHRLLRGEETLVNYTTLGRTGWSVGTVSPYEEVIKHIGTITTYTMMVLLVGLIILLVVLRYVIKRSTRSLDDLTKAAYRIARGDFSAPLPHVSGNDSMRTLTDAIDHMQQSLAEYVSTLKQSTVDQARIQSELDIAHGIQKNTIPRTFPTTAGGDGIDVYAMLRTSRNIGGDFYDFMIADGVFHFCIGTVSGDGGVSTSLLMTAIRSVFRSAISSEQMPEVTIKAMADVLRDSPQADVRSTVFVGALNLSTGILTYANASHNAPLLVRPDGMTEFLPGSSALPLGVDVMEECRPTSVQLEVGARMVFFTDGIINATNGGGAAYTDYTLYHMVTIIMANYPHLTARELLTRIDRSVKDHMGGEEQKRDQALMTFTYSGRSQTHK